MYIYIYIYMYLYVMVGELDDTRRNKILFVVIKL